MTTPAGWYADPTAQFEQRYWDGAAWTEHVTTQGQAGVSPLAPTAEPVIVPSSTPDRIQRQVYEKAKLAPVAGGGGSVFTEPILVVNQKAKFVEVTAEYAVFDQAGRQLASVKEVGQGMFRKFLRLFTKYDQFFTHRYELRGNAGELLLTVTRPWKIFKSKVIIGTPEGHEVGRIIQKNVIGKINFAFQVGGNDIGAIKAENWRAWNFSIVDHTGGEVARVTKTWEGLAKTMFTTADNYVVQIHRPLEDPLRLLVVASALTVDVALKQDARGLN